MNPDLKNFLRQVTPPFMVNGWKSYCARTHRWTEQQQLLKTAYEQRNTGRGAGEMMFREGMALEVHPDSRIPFEYFCYVSLESVEEMDCFLEHTGTQQRLLDIGALHGVFSLAFAAHHPEKRAVAVDASPIAFGRLLYNLHKNRATNVVPVECAISDAPGFLAMHYEWEHAMASGTNEKSKTLSVPKQTGDSLCQSLDFNPDVIKIDVEGHEVKVLRGLRDTIQRNRPLIFLEVHPRWIADENDRLQDLVDELSRFGYQAAYANGQKFDLREIASFEWDQRLVLRPS